MRLKEKVAIITGGASGFGRGIVERFINEGAKVVIADINLELANQVADGLGDNCIAVEVNVSNALDIEKMIDETIKNFLKIDILVQNAAIGMKPQALVDTSIELYDKLFNTNVKSIFLGSKNIIPVFSMRQVFLGIVPDFILCPIVFHPT